MQKADADIVFVHNGSGDRFRYHNEEPIDAVLSTIPPENITLTRKWDLLALIEAGGDGAEEDEHKDKEDGL
jgi:hypothetical protein